MTENDQLPNHCPHCDLSQVHIFEKDYGRWQVKCGHCGAHCGSCKSAYEAIALWNSVKPEAKQTSLELMARALCKASGYDPDGNGLYGNQVMTAFWPEFLDRAAVELARIQEAGERC